jgi:hypothetical protein
MLWGDHLKTLMPALWGVYPIPTARFPAHYANRTITPKETMMKTPAIPNEIKSRKKAAAKAVPAKLETLSKRSAAKVIAPKTEKVIKPVGLLLERFPNRDKKCTCLELFAPDAKVVFVAGSFNGWHPSAMPLQKQAGDRWAVELILDPGRYEYRFVVDGRWTDDPLSSAYVSNPFEGLNCVLEVGLQT